MSSPESGAGAFQLSPLAAGTLAARGPLTFGSARRALAAGQQALAGAAARELEIDGAGISECDSAGLAVLLEWLAIARRSGGVLRYRQLPDGLVALARISEVDGLLGL